MNIRRIAKDLLVRREAGDAYINLAIGRACERLSDTDRRFLTALVYGTVERKLTLDYAIGALTHRTDVSPAARAILRPALYELAYLRTPVFATVNEWVSLAGSPSEKRFVNGVLRAAARLSALPLPPREKNELRYLSVRYSVPVDTLRRLSPVLGGDLEAFLSATETQSGITLRVNTEKISRDDYLARLAACHIEAEPTNYAPCGVRLPKSHPPKDLPGFSEGLFFVQDEASQLAVEVLSPEAGETVVDLCACPGGKSFGAAMRMQNRGRVLAFDLHESKLSLITSGAARLGITCITAEQHDGREPLSNLTASCDRVLCDAPCSGLGVLSKKPDLRYKDQSAADELPSLQSCLLDTAAACVKPGGVLLYSTCTVNPRENGEVAAAFLTRHPDFVREDFSVGSLSSENGELTLYPHIHGTDGFFLAKFRRENPTKGQL